MLVTKPPRTCDSGGGFMARIAVLILLTVLYSLTSQGMSTTMRKSVAVIGAGPAGISAALHLPKSEFRTRLFEKHDVGGKCRTIRSRDGRGVVELGAIQVGFGYDIFNEQRRLLNIPLRKTWDSYALVGKDENGAPIIKTLQEQFWPLHHMADIAVEINTMHQALNRFAPIMEHGFESLTKDSEFLAPFEQWATSHGLTHYLHDYGIWITSYGYGQLNQIPAYLPLSLINSSIGLVAMRMANMNLRQVSSGYQDVMQKIVAHHQLDVQTHVNIRRILRNEKTVEVVYETCGQTYREEFDHVIVACGLSCAADIFGEENLTVAEKELRDDLQFKPYDVVIATIPNLPKGGYVLPNFFKTEGHVSLMSKNSAKTDDVIVYIPRGGISTFKHPLPASSDEDLTKRVVEDLDVHGFTVTDITHIERWPNYFPHFQRWQSYEKLASIQGQNRTFYVSSESSFEIVERAMATAKKMVQHHFLEEEPQEPSALKRFQGLLTTIYEYINSEDKDK